MFLLLKIVYLFWSVYRRNVTISDFQTLRTIFCAEIFVKAQNKVSFNLLHLGVFLSNFSTILMKSKYRIN